MRIKDHLKFITKAVVYSMLSVVLFVGCNEDYTYFPVDTNLPAAGFSYSANFLNVTVTNSSDDATNYLWNFGDGTESTDVNPAAHEYASAGDYTITLVAYDNNKMESEKVVNITVAAEPTDPFAAFSYSVDFEEVTFTNSSTRSTSYEWDFGDGTAVSAEESPVHTYSAAGEYTVTLTAMRDGEEDSVLEQVVATGDAAFLNPIFEGSKSDWGGSFSTSSSPTPPAGAGAKLDSSEKFLLQTLRVYKNTKYRITFSCAIKDSGSSKNAPFTIYSGESVDADNVITTLNLDATPNDNTYTEQTIDFDSGEAEYITVNAVYGDVEIRYSNFAITAM